MSTHVISSPCIIGCDVGKNPVRHRHRPRWQLAGRMQEDIRTLTRVRTQLVKQRAALSNQIKAGRSPRSILTRFTTPLASR